MLTKALSVLLTIMLLISALTVLPLSASAQEADPEDETGKIEIADVGADAEVVDTGIPSESQFAASISSLQQTYVHGQYWNKASCSDYSRTGNIPCNGISYSSYHYGQRCSAVGYCDYCSDECGYFAGAYQCWGFAYKMAYLSLGSYPTQSGWVQSYSLGTVCAGDIIRIRNDTHSIFVYKVVGSTIYFADCNWTGPCQVRWGGAYSYSDLAGTLTYKWHLSGNNLTGNPEVKPSGAWMSVDKTAGYVGDSFTFTFGANDAAGYNIGIDRNGSRIITEGVSSGKTYTFNEAGSYTAYVSAYNSAGYVDSNVVSFIVTDALNLGQRFTAIIVYNGGGYVVAPDYSGNVKAQEYYDNNKLSSKYSRQLWVFERQSDLSYKISSIGEVGKCLNVASGSSADNTSIHLYESNDSAAQRWYIRRNGSGYSLVPKCALSSAMDLHNGITGEESKVQLFSFIENGEHQVFSFRYIDYELYRETYDGKTYELFNYDMPWKEAYKFCEQRGGHLVTINSQGEQDFVYDFVKRCGKNDFIWMGATDAFSEGKWGWITGEEMLYQHWTSGEPNDDHDEDYMMMYKSSGEWNDVYDNYRSTVKSFSFICEYEQNLLAEFAVPIKTFTFNNHRYEVYTNTLDWQTAKKLCEAKGGHLVTIGSSAENNAIHAQIIDTSRERYWIGLTDVDMEGRWKWVNGESTQYQNWSDGEPNNDSTEENYAEIHSGSGKWNDIAGYYCIHVSVGFICEYEPEDTGEKLLGDADSDGDVTILDATAVQRKLAELSVSSYDKQAADADGDDDVTIMDATAIQRHIAELPTNPNIGKPIAS